MKTKLLAHLAVWVLQAGTLLAQIPQILNYQGRVAVGTPAVNFDGSGQFKFALVNAAGTTSHWSNDGTSTAGSQPTNAVSLTVTKGLYSVLLGDTTLPNMTAIPNSAFNNADVRLRVWFNDGSHGWQRLTPDQRIAAVGYAMMAGNVPDGSITAEKLAPGVGGGAIADGSNTGGRYIPASDSWANLTTTNAPVATSGHRSVWTGSEMMVFGGSPVAASRYYPLTNSWLAMGSLPANLSEFENLTTLWTGGGMLLFQPSLMNSLVASYSPIADYWLILSNTGAPDGNAPSLASVWTGTEMIVWGASWSSSDVIAGGRYAPASDAWTSLSAAGAPATDYGTGIWTGSEMLMWGGAPGTAGTNGKVSDKGHRYRPPQYVYLYRKP